jgi:hypothetical protein
MTTMLVLLRRQHRPPVVSLQVQVVLLLLLFASSFLVVNGFGLSSSSIRRKRIQIQKRIQKRTILTSSLTNNDKDNIVSTTALLARSTAGSSSSSSSYDDDDDKINTGTTTTTTTTTTPTTTVLVVGGSGRVGGSTVRWLQELAGRDSKLNIKIKVGGRTKKSFEQAKKRGVLPSDMNAEDDFIQLDWAEWNEEQIETAILSSSDNNNNNNIGLVIHTAGPFQGRTDPTLLRCCIKHKIHYVDVCDEYELAVTSKELFHDDAKQLGITAVVSSGIWPGVSALMAANAVEKLEEQEQEEDDNENDDSSSAKNSNNNKAETIDFSFFTAGTGNAGPTIVSATFLLLATPVIAYRNSKKVELEPWTEKRIINFGKSIQDKPVWLLDNPDVPTTALSLGSGSDRSGIPNVSSRFGTDPLPWNYLFGAMKAIPRSILYNREIMQNFALFSEPIIRVVDQIVGSTNAMRVDVSNKEKTKTITSLIVHHDLEMAVGLATAAFAIEVLKKNSNDNGDDNNDNDDDDEQQEQQTIPSGVWYPAELPKQARSNILEVVKEGTITYEV